MIKIMMKALVMNYKCTDGDCHEDNKDYDEGSDHEPSVLWISVL